MHFYGCLLFLKVKSVALGFFVQIHFKCFKCHLDLVTNELQIKNNHILTFAKRSETCC